ncbi:MAG TPA: CHASE2 domain-containing protein [Allosphingosinicella sp.]|jgi:serine phosphatase RsbU (regulator of sigma subunit)/CHASE2 domain-containing sensor protein|uniref:CHASE2 domain-containing protein n=1 Tax=Allosphingosinicella sp. TaxID=2823234 RepID=UPI002F285271
MTAFKPVSEPGRRLLRIRIAGLAGALAAGLLLLVSNGALSRPLFDAWQRLGPRDIAATKVHVVVIDPESLAAGGPWPWPRYHLARLTEEIAARGAAAIGFDMIFAEPDRVRPDIVADLYPELSPAAAAELRSQKPMDQLFGEVIGRAPVVLARAGLQGGGGIPSDLPVEATFAGTLPSAVAEYPQALTNIAELDEVALGHGLINGAPDGDGVVRRLPMVAKVGGQPMPGFALELARVALEADRIDAAPGTIALGGSRVPTDRQGRMILRFGEFPARQVTSAVDVMRRDFPGNAFAGKVVLVGLAAEGTADIVATPLAAESFGVFVHAQAVDAILGGNGWLSRPGWTPAAEWGAAALLVLMALALITQPRRAAISLPLAGGIVVGLSWAAFDYWSLLLDPLPPLALGGGAAAGLSLGMFAQARRERESLREQLVDERVAAAATAAELDAARTIQLGMLPPRAELAQLDPRLDLAAALEPARSVGGDFYDAVRLSADRIAFTVADVTGKGVPASLFMAVSKALSKSVVLRERDLAGAAAMLNEELSRGNGDSGVTMLLGVIDLATGELELVNAGHEDPIRLRSDGSVEGVKMEGGPPFCIVDYPWPVETLRLQPGEALVLMTDGVTEAQDPKGAFYGRALALATVAEGRGARADEIVEGLVQSVRGFEAGAEAGDDLTVMVLRYVG